MYFVPLEFFWPKCAIALTPLHVPWEPGPVSKGKPYELPCLQATSLRLTLPHLDRFFTAFFGFPDRAFASEMKGSSTDALNVDNGAQQLACHLIAYLLNPRACSRGAIVETIVQYFLCKKKAPGSAEGMSFISQFWIYVQYCCFLTGRFPLL